MVELQHRSSVAKIKPWQSSRGLSAALESAVGNASEGLCRRRAVSAS
jgi:hypothetical protein